MLISPPCRMKEDQVIASFYTIQLMFLGSLSFMWFLYNNVPLCTFPYTGVLKIMILCKLQKVPIKTA